MAEPKDDPDTAHFMRKVASHLGNSHLEENLNGFFELHTEELRSELRSSSSESEDGPAPPEQGVYSLRVHQLYEDFLEVVQSNLEEFLHAEGLTESELKEACEREMLLADDPTGASFMRTLISSWEFESFVALATDFVDEIDEDSEDDVSSQAPSESSSAGTLGGGNDDSGRERRGSVGINDDCLDRTKYDGGDKGDDITLSQERSAAATSATGDAGRNCGERHRDSGAVIGRRVDTGLSTASHEDRRVGFGVKSKNRDGVGSYDDIPSGQELPWRSASANSESEEVWEDDEGYIDENPCMRAQAKT